MTPSSKILSIVALAGYPILLHWAVLSNSDLAITLALSVLFVFYLAAILKHSPRPRPAPIISILVLAALMLAFHDVAARYVLVSVPFLIYVFLFLVFGRTLLANQEPLIAQISRRERGGILPGELTAYTRNLTLVWTIYFAVAAVTSVVLVRYATLATWSTFANLGNYLALALLFFGEYIYRLARFPNLPHASPVRVIRAIVRDGLPSSRPNRR